MTFIDLKGVRCFKGISFITLAELDLDRPNSAG